MRGLILIFFGILISSCVHLNTSTLVENNEARQARSPSSLLPAKGVVGRFKAPVLAKILCMDYSERKVSENKIYIGPKNYNRNLDVITFDKFAILSINISTYPFTSSTVSIQSSELDESFKAYCRIDLNEEDFNKEAVLN